MNRGTILIVEDEPAIATLINYNLEQAGFLTEIAYDGEQALKLVDENEFTLIILDVMLPKIDGMTVCKTIREAQNDVPILMLTAKGNENDRVYGLEIGADDYLTKPFSPRELIARIDAILRRTVRSEKNKREIKITVGTFEIFPDRFEAYKNGELLQLTRKEFDLLVYFMEHAGKTLSREQLFRSVWEYDFIGDTRTVDVQVSHLREKIETNTKQPEHIKTVRGFGYKFVYPNQ